MANKANREILARRGRLTVLGDYNKGLIYLEYAGNMSSQLDPHVRMDFDKEFGEGMFDLVQSVILDTQGRPDSSWFATITYDDWICVGLPTFIPDSTYVSQKED